MPRLNSQVLEFKPERRLSAGSAPPSRAAQRHLAQCTRGSHERAACLHGPAAAGGSTSAWPSTSRPSAVPSTAACWAAACRPPTGDGSSHACCAACGSAGGASYLGIMVNGATTDACNAGDDGCPTQSVARRSSHAVDATSCWAAAAGATPGLGEARRPTPCWPAASTPAAPWAAFGVAPARRDARRWHASLARHDACGVRSPCRRAGS